MAETKTSNETSDENQLPPPPYNTVLQKLNDPLSNPYSSTAPPNYADINLGSVVYINNYPGPPISDGAVQIITYPEPNIVEQSTFSSEVNKKIRRFMFINGIFTSIVGIITVVIQIILIASHALVYYYLGFWAGALIISLGISTIMMNNRLPTANLRKYFRSFIWQGVFVLVIFVLGLIIILTNPCRRRFPNSPESCSNEEQILNGVLLALIGLTLLQTVSIVVVLGVLKRRYG